MPNNWFKYDDKVRPIANKFGEEILFLGSGLEGGVWSIDNNYIIKLIKRPFEPETHPLSRLEPKIYGYGQLENVSWVIKDYFDTPKPEHFDLFQDIIIDLQYYIEINSELKSIKDIVTITSKSYKDFVLKSSTGVVELERAKVLYELHSDWLFALTFEMTYKTLTDRNMDFHSGNLGFERISRKPIFFDW